MYMIFIKSLLHLRLTSSNMPLHCSSDASPPRRRRHDSPEDASPPRRGQQPRGDASPPRRGRQPSPDLSPPRKRGAAEGGAQEAEGDAAKRQRMMSDGAIAGMVSGGRVPRGPEEAGVGLGNGGHDGLQMVGLRIYCLSALMCSWHMLSA
jgi:hypothetical protein